MPGICSCITAPITVPINCRYGCSSITRAITDLRPETAASAPHFGTMYSGRCCADDLGPTDWSSRQPVGSRPAGFSRSFGVSHPILGMFGDPLGGLFFGGEALDHFRLAIRPKNIDHPAKSGIFSRHENGPVFGHP